MVEGPESGLSFMGAAQVSHGPPENETGTRCWGGRSGRRKCEPWAHFPRAQLGPGAFCPHGLKE